VTQPEDEGARESSPPLAPGSPPSTGRLGRRVAFAMLLGVLLYGVLVVVRGASAISAALATFAWSSFGWALALAASNYALRFVKWEYYLAVLEVRGVPKLDSFLTFLSGFVLTVTPGKVGEVFKSFVLQRIHDVPVERTAPIVVAERVTDLIGVIVMIAAGSSTFPGGGVWATLGALVVVGVIGLVSSERLSRLFLDLLARLPGPLGRVARRLEPKVVSALRSLRVLTRAKHLVVPAALSVVAWGLEGVALGVLLRGFGAELGMLPVGFFYATATLAGALVPVPGGLGVTEKILEEGLYRVGGVASEVATASMILVRFATLWFAVLVGFGALGLLRARHPRLAN
jgi:uncharacterized protein (TIRG00374 family)